MTRLSVVAVAAVCAAFACRVAPAQVAAQGTMSPMKHEAGTPSTTLTLTGVDGTTKTLTVADLMRLPQTNATVMNGHTHQQETYGGVTVKDLLALLAPAKIVPVTDGMKTKVSSRMMVVIARGTDNFRVALTLCDTDPGCRPGQAMVADTVDGRPLTTDGAFKLILTEDKTPGRWVRNLDALTVKNLGAM